MAYSEKDKKHIFDSVCKLIEGGKSLRLAIEGQGIPRKTFLDWADSDPEKGDQYARACEARTEKMADEIMTISDDETKDVYRSRLQVDSRKWLLSKLNPKKYGDKLDVTTDGKPLDNKIEVEIVRPKK